MRDAVEADVPAFIAALAADLARAGESWTYDRAGPEARQLDTLSVQQWLEAKLPDASAPLGSLLRTLVLNMFGVASGRSQLARPARAVRAVGGGTRPVALRRMDRSDDGERLARTRRQRPGGLRHGRTVGSWVHPHADPARDGAAYGCGPRGDAIRRPRRGGRRRSRRSSRSRSRRCARSSSAGAGFSDEKVASIRELGMGSDPKLLLGLDRRVAAHASWRGFAAKDGPDMFVWDSSVGQPGTSGVLTVFTGERVFEATEPHGPPAASSLKDGIEAADVMVPGIGGSATAGRGWTRGPTIRGAAAPMPRSCPVRSRGGSASSGCRKAPCTSPENTRPRPHRAISEGAVESGERAAREVRASIGVSV